MVEWLPHVNVTLNGMSLCLLVAGFVLIKRGHERAHRFVMLAALATSVAFLISYVIYHVQVPSKRFPDDPRVAPTAVRYFYYALLLSHVVLAATVPFLAAAAVYFGLRDRRAAHRRVVRWAWPIWVYVSATGVAVYAMLYRIYAVALLVAVVWTGTGVGRAVADQWGGLPPVRQASAGQRLRMEQVLQLMATGQTAEAIENLERLYDEGLGRVVEVGGVQRAGTQSVQCYQSLRRWVQTRLVDVLAADGEAADGYRRRMEAGGVAALREARQTPEGSRVWEAAQRFGATPAGPKLYLAAADWCLERGWMLAAIDAVERAVPELRMELNQEEDEVGLPWPVAWRNHRRWGGSSAELAEERFGRLADALSDPRRRPLVLEGVHRMVLAAISGGDVVDRDGVLDWASATVQRFGGADELGTRELIEQARTWPSGRTADRWTEFAGQANRNGRGSGQYRLEQWPTWSQSLDAYTAGSDRTPASKPRAGETEDGILAFFPVTDGRRVYVNGLHRIHAFELDTGAPWPPGRMDGVLFDSQIASAAFLPLGYPLVGSPRGTLALAGDALYARMGSPVTGWANFESAVDGGSLGYLVGLDLSREGLLLPGFPLRLHPPTFEHAEFEGAPVVFEDMIVVAILERDNVGVRRGVAAFNRWNGDLVWYTGPLAAGSVEGIERANLISHQLVSSAGGRLFYNTNLGHIVCLDPVDGSVVWQTRYRRQSRQGRTYPRPDRFRYRSLTPCLVAGGLVYCAPQDAPEIFALDATNGALVWSTDAGATEDVIHLLGIAGEYLVGGGDHAIWLDRGSGRLIARFPGANTPGMVHALPEPRGLGRGVVVGERLYWPVAGEVLVLQPDEEASQGAVPIDPADRSGVPLPGLKPVAIRARYALGSRGAEGGNLVPAGEYLMYASPRRLMAFERLPRDARAGWTRIETR